MAFPRWRTTFSPRCAQRLGSASRRAMSARRCGSSSLTLPPTTRFASMAFLRSTHAADRDRLARRLELRRIGVALMEGRSDHAGRDAVDAYLAADELLRLAARQGRDEALGRGIENGAACAAVARRDRGRV